MLEKNAHPIKTTSENPITITNFKSTSDQFGVGVSINAWGSPSPGTPPWHWPPGYCWSSGAASLDDKQNKLEVK